MTQPETSPNSHRVCEACGGAGFLRAGEFWCRTFPRCVKCEGIGQVYLVPVVERKPVLQG